MAAAAPLADGAGVVDVAVVEDLWGEAFDDLATRRTVVRLPDTWKNAAALRSIAVRTRALVVRNMAPVTRDLLAAAPHLEIVARAGSGLDNVDLAAAEEAGVVVVSTPGANATSVGEHTVGLALAMARRIVELDRSTRAGEWNRTMGHELSGGTWGLIAAGRTARATARLARGFGMRVLAYDPYVDPDSEDFRSLQLRLTAIEEVVASADVLSLHVPLTEETRGMVGAALLALAKKHVILVNVSRGEVLDEDALADALEGGRIAGACLDVRRGEPPRCGRLERLSNVLLTPHVAGLTVESQARIARMLCADIDAVLDGGEASCAVTRICRPQRAS